MLPLTIQTDRSPWQKGEREEEATKEARTWLGDDGNEKDEVEKIVEFSSSTRQNEKNGRDVRATLLRSWLARVEWEQTRARTIEKARVTRS